MPVSRRLLAVNRAIVPHGLGVADASRSTLLADDGSRRLWMLDSRDLSVIGSWQLDADAIGTHAVRHNDETALVSGRGAVTMLDAAGREVWRFGHPPFDEYSSGAAWFDAEGSAFALVPLDEGCEVVHFGASGEPLHRAPIPRQPAGLEVVHRSDGWAGLSIGEGQDGVYAWWVRLAGNQLHVIEAPWSDEILFDDQDDRVLTTPHHDGPIRVRSFPQLERLREIDPPPGCWWDFFACFASGDHVVARAITNESHEEILVAVDPAGADATLAQSIDPIVPGPEGSWFASTPEGVERWCLA